MPFKSLGVVSYSPSIVTLWPYLQSFWRYSASKNGLTLKTGLGHRNRVECTDFGTRGTASICPTWILWLQNKCEALTFQLNVKHFHKFTLILSNFVVCLRFNFNLWLLWLCCLDYYIIIMSVCDRLHIFSHGWLSIQVDIDRWIDLPNLLRFFGKGIYF